MIFSVQNQLNNISTREIWRISLGMFAISIVIKDGNLRETDLVALRNTMSTTIDVINPIDISRKKEKLGIVAYSRFLIDLFFLCATKKALLINICFFKFNLRLLSPLLSFYRIRKYIEKKCRGINTVLIKFHYFRYLLWSFNAVITSV